MMTKTQTLRESITVARSAHDAYQYLADFSTIEQWDPGVYRSRKLDPGPAAPGSRFEVVLNLPGGRETMQYELVEAEDDTRLVLHGKARNFTAIDTITLAQDEQGHTRIDYEAVLSFDGWQAPFLPLMRPLLDVIGRRAVDGLAAALEVEPPKAWQTDASWKDRLVLPAAWEFTQAGYLKMPRKGLSERLDGKTVVVTGPTSGLGLATASECARLGARVVLVGRDAARMREAMQQIVDFSGCPESRLAIYLADLSLAAEAWRVGGEIREREARVDVLVNNAGALFGERDETEDGVERALAINLLAPWVLTDALLKPLKAARGRVINVASGGMYLQPVKIDDLNYRRGRYDGAKAYARAKRALIDITEELAARHPEIGFHAMHPGWAQTPGVARSLPKFNEMLDGRLRDARMGADTIIWLASARAVEASSGLFWFDRQPRPVEVIPGTASSVDVRRRVLEWLDSQHPRTRVASAA